MFIKKMFMFVVQESGQQLLATRFFF